MECVDSKGLIFAVLNEHVEVVPGLQEILLPVLQLVPAHVLDDAHLHETNELMIRSEEIERLDYELSVVGELLNVFGITNLRLDLDDLREGGISGLLAVAGGRTDGVATLDTAGWLSIGVNCFVSVSGIVGTGCGVDEPCEFTPLTQGVTIGLGAFHRIGVFSW